MWEEMDFERLVAAAPVATPILLLFLAGGIIAARSGVERVASARDVLRIVANFSAILLRVAVYVALLLLVQRVIGQRSTLGW